MLVSEAVLANQEIPEDQSVHTGSQKAVDGLVGPADNWLAVVERRIEYDRHARHFLERLDDLPVARHDGTCDGLQSPGTIDVGHGRNLGLAFGAHSIDPGHKGVRLVLLEVVARGLA